MQEALKKIRTSKWFSRIVKIGIAYIILDALIALIIFVWMYQNV